MIFALILAAITDFILFTLGLILSFAVSPRLRLRFRMATALLAIPLAGICYFIAVPEALIPFLWKEPRNLTELEKDFPAKRADLETILRMSAEDPDFSHIGPDFVNRTVGASAKSTPYKKPDPQVGLPRPRWDAYRSIFARNGIRNGLERSVARDVIIEIDTIGMFNHGRVVGYAWCAPVVPEGALREYPCNHVTEASGASFQRLDGAWYAFAQ